MGLPCAHEILKKLETVQILTLDDIHRQWHVDYIRPEPGTITNALEPSSYTPVITLLNPGAIKPKGRPKGALGIKNRGTRRDPSLFEHVVPSQSSQASKRNCGHCSMPGHDRRRCPNKENPPSSTPSSSGQIPQSEIDFLTYYGECFPASQDVDLSPADHPPEVLDLREDLDEVLRRLGVAVVTEG
jgi:hypothetical protein